MNITIDKVADFFIQRAHDTGSLLTNLKLQKLCYYAQAWYLAIYERPLFEASFEAWVHGPVNRELYKRFKELKWNPISQEVSVGDLQTDVKDHLEMIVDNFFACDAYELERMTHEELPWKEARGDIPEDVPCKTEINLETMKTFYAKMLTDVEAKTSENTC